MKKHFQLFVLLILISCLITVSCEEKTIIPEKKIAGTLLIQIDSFSSACSRLKTIVESASADQNTLQQAFLQCRLSYKKFEWAAEYFDPLTAKAVNGPPVQEVEVSGPYPAAQSYNVFEPSGLQIIEGLLFPVYDTTRKRELLKQMDVLQAGCDRYRTRFKNVDILDWQVFDAAKLEVFRIETLGITGFDNPLTKKSMQESAAALDGVQKALALYENKTDSQRLVDRLGRATDYLANHTDFDAFNRMEFISAHANPVTEGISDLETKLNIHVIRYNRLLNQDAKTLFDTNAFNVNAYAPDHSSFIANDKIALGKILFSDPILSGTGKRSCQSCHQPSKAFADGLAKNTIIDQHELLERNTPTLINAALQPALFYDLRVNTLEDQSVNVVQSSKEMHGSMVMSVKKLWQDRKYRQMFLAAFPYEDSTRIDTFEVMNAIGSYIRSLVFLNSRFDEYMRGDKSKMNTDEISGFNLFMGKGKCATCHYMPLFNGTFPPRFARIEAEVIGVPISAKENRIDPDMGRYAIIKVESFKHAFKTSTVRNAALTAPYMHNGVFNTLEQVMDFYNKGGGTGLGIKMENQTLPFDSLSLSRKEQDDIIAFIKSLNSELPKN
ncbi:MAG TPA: cytochrome c peroxidase [Puia sp.]|nr:cytochrome c peroxidase [Puia sp.]